MWRPLLDRYYPHVLLLAFAAACLTLTPKMYEPTAEHVRVDEYVAVDVVGLLPYEASEIDLVDGLQAQMNLRKLLQGAHMKQVRAKLNHRDDAEPEEAPAEMRSITLTDSPQHEPAPTNNATILIEAPIKAVESQPEYVGGIDPLAWKAPDAVEQTEFSISGYGTIGDVEPARKTAGQAVNTQTTMTLSRAESDSTAFTLPKDQSPTVEDSPAGFATSSVATSPIQADATEALPPLPTQQASELSLPASSSRSTRTIAQVAEVKADVDRTVPTLVSQQEQIQTQTAVLTKSLAGPESTQVTSVDKTDSSQKADKLPGASLASISDTSDTQQQTLIPKQQKSQSIAAVPGIANTEKPDPQDTPGVAQSHDTSTTAKPTRNIDTDKKQSQPVVVLVDESGSIVKDRLNAIDNAVQQINQVAKQAEIDIELSVTTNSNAEHNILVREDTNEALKGKLGLAESAALVDDQGNERRLGQNASDLGGKAIANINSDINWYAGDDISAIGKNQYDYQTAITHELLHLLGLDDDFIDDGLVMHGYLSQGETRRVIAAAETQELASRYSSANLWGAVTSSVNQYASQSRKNVRCRSEALTAAPVPEPAGVTLGSMCLASILLRRRH